MTDTYATSIRREGDWWVIEVEGVGVTQAKRLDQADEMARDLVHALQDVPANSFDLAHTVYVSDDVDRLRIESDRLAREAEELTEKARATREDVMAKLKAERISARDIGKLTGVSHQRVSQVSRHHAKGTVRGTREDAISAAKALWGLPSGVRASKRAKGKV